MTEDRAITVADAQELLARWWFSYDEARSGDFASFFTDDAVFTVGVDDPTVAWAEFATAERSGVDSIVEWQTEHRLDSPSPLRHHQTTFLLTGAAGDEASFASYLLVNHVVDDMPSLLPSGTASGTVRRTAAGLRIARLDVVLDVRTSTTLREQRGK